ncbi:MAG: MFS transporter [Mogibacterium sp.]|nr:MFS transporter [Mogibacterium sp.]
MEQLEQANRPKPKLFYGWIIMVCSFLLMAVSIGLINNTMNQFIVPICDQFGVTRAKAALLTSCVGIGHLIAMPFVGDLLKRFNQKRLIRGSILAMLLVWVGYSFASNIYILWALGVAMGIVNSLAGLVMINSVVNNWFHAKKGFVVGFTSTGTGFGGAIFNPIASKLIVAHGYQYSMRMLALISLIMCLPFLITIVYKPEQIGLLPYGDEEGFKGDRAKLMAGSNVGMKRREAVKNKKFWILVVVTMIIAQGVIGIFHHVTAYMTDLGYSVTQTAFCVSVINISLACSKLFFGWLNDKIGTKRNYILMMSIGIFGMISMVMIKQINRPLLTAILFGIAFAITNLFVPLMVVQVTGNKEYPQIYGLMSTFTSLGSLLGSPLSGLVYDKTGSYTPIFAVYTALYVVALILGTVLLNHPYNNEEHLAWCASKGIPRAEGE